MQFIIRNYRDADLQSVRNIFGEDEFARPRLLKKHPRMKEYLADEVSHYYTHYEPESVFVAEADGTIIGALLGAKNTLQYTKTYRLHIKPYLVRRCLSGVYGWPVWWLANLRTDFAGRNLKVPQVDYEQYPAHLHIGVLPSSRRKGVGTELMQRYAHYLQQYNVPGYHLYVSSFHPLGYAFYRKLGMDYLGQFDWLFYDGYEWMNVTETILGQRLQYCER